MSENTEWLKEMIKGIDSKRRIHGVKVNWKVRKGEIKGGCEY